MGHRNGGLVALAAAAALTAVSMNVMGVSAYTSGSVGYDVSYAQCGSVAAAPAMSQPAGSATPAARSSTAAGPAVPASSPGSFPSRGAAPASSAAPYRSRGYAFGIVGVDSGFPFTTTSPGNPCLAKEYGMAPIPGLYVNTGYDPSYTDSTHTTSSCATQSGTVRGSSAQQAAWAVGCSEAQSDYSYAQSQGITSAAGWWLDVETANSWCGQQGTNCSDPSLNQYTLQGLIDTFTHIGAVPVGIYSNKSEWGAIVGSLPVTGATGDWVASGATTWQDAAAECAASFSFSGAPVQLVQFVPAAIDRDYAC